MFNFILLSVVAFLVTEIEAQNKGNGQYTMAFGSCFAHKVIRRDNLTVFPAIIKQNPDSFVWLGDATYTDTYNWTSYSYYIEPDVKQIQKKFDEVTNHADYKALARTTKIYGVWDDHDYGIDDGGKDNPIKELMRGLYLDFLDEPRDSVRRTRPDGIYGAYYLDPERKVKLILLDNRFSKDEGNDKTIPESQKSSLGKAQEEWLAEEIRNSKAIFTIIGAGVMMIPDEDRGGQERIYDVSRRVVMETVNKDTNIILISGDVHYGEIIKDDCSQLIHGYAIHEFVSSGLSHSDAEYPYIGPLPYWLIAYRFPETFSTEKDRYPGRNGGILKFELGSGKADSSVTFQLLDINGNIALSKTLDGEFFNKPNSKPDIAAYRRCHEQAHEASAKGWKLFFNNLCDVTNSISQAIYCAVFALFLIIYLVFKLIKYLVSFLSFVVRLMMKMLFGPVPEPKSDEKKNK